MAKPVEAVNPNENLPHLFFPDFAGPSIQKVSNYDFLLPEDRQHQLYNLARKGNVSVEKVLLRLFQILLFRYSGRKNIKVAIFNQQHHRVTDEISLNRETVFNEIIQTGKNQPGESLYYFLNESESIPDHFDVVFRVEHLPEGKCSLIYNASKYRSERIKMMAEHYLALLDQIEREHAPISKMNFLTDKEKGIIKTLADQKWDYPSDLCIHHFIEQQAEHRPNETAVVFEDETLTYGELNMLANKLAFDLLNRGVNPDTVIGLCIERSTKMIVGLVGILKSGGAYLPLDPALPKDRLEYMLAEAQVPIVVSENKWSYLLSGYDGEMVDLEKSTASSEIQINNPISGVNNENGAYVIFTSGSTGHPKGVLVEHRNIVNYTFNVINDLDVEPGTKFAVVSTLAADVSNTSLFPALSSGGELHIISRNTSLDPDQMAQYMKTNKIDILKIVPSHLMALLSSKSPEDIFPSDKIVIGGELLKADLVQTIRELAPHCAIVNSYGPTETTVAVLTQQINPEELFAATSSMPIGSPMKNSFVYILDDCLQPVPVGMPGELYIGGAGVSRGYINRPDIMKEKFIADPFCDNNNGKLYRTGDKVRYLLDGSLEFIGRMDGQVKIRGYRVEPGEIEANLEQNDDVQKAVVIKSETNEQLVAYIVTTAHSTCSEAGLKSFLKEQLPDYMIPDIIMFLKKIPVTSNGKLDKLALPDPYNKNRAELFKHADEIEKELYQLWLEILGTSNISPSAGFIESGGHSLQAMKLLSRIRSRFHVDFHIQDIMENKTIKEQAEQISNLRNDDFVDNDRAISKVKGPAWLSFSQERLWFLDRYGIEQSVYNLPIVFEIKGVINSEALEFAIRETVKRHEILRTNFKIEKENSIQYVHPEREMHLEIIDFEGDKRAEEIAFIENYINNKVKTPFDLVQDPLIRFSLIKTDSLKSIFVINMHHIISDGWSNRILLREISGFYRMYVKKQPYPFSPLDIQYRDFSVWQRDRWDQGVFNEQLHYWENKLRKPLPVLKMPVQKHYSAVNSYEGNSLYFEINESLAQRLKVFSKSEGSTLYMTLLAAFQTLLYRYSGQDDVLVGTSVANRSHEGTEKLIGFFVNTLIIRTDISGKPDFQEVLRRVRKNVLEAFSNQELPFEKLIERLQPDRHPLYPPITQAFFAFQTNAENRLELEGLELVPKNVDTETAKFPLTLSVRENKEKLTGVLEYNKELFDTQMMERFIKHYKKLVDGMITEPQKKIHKIDFLTEIEKEIQFSGLSGTQVNIPEERCVHELFEEQVKAEPNRSALLYGDQQLTYEQLNKRANQFAGYLRKRGVQKGTLVGLCIEKSMDMIIGLLAILKAGGAYVPLDPNYPNDRLSYMISDSQIKLLLTKNHLLSSLPYYGGEVVLLDKEGSNILKNRDLNLINMASPDSPAYVVYTSGSTGKPKGVVVPHKALINHNIAFGKMLDLEPKDNVLQFRSISFDVAAEEIFPSLLSGSTVVILDNNQIDYIRLNEFVAGHKISIMNLPTAYWNEWVYELLREEQSLPDSLRTIITGGEKVLSDKVSLWKQLRGNKNVDLIIAYGPTETTISMMVHRISALSDGQETTPGSIIGGPIDNTKVMVLDHYLQPVPLGVPGELFIGGQCLADGYLNKPDLTKKKFIRCSLSANKSERFYQTGDIVRCTEEGIVEYLGRVDNQVKIRGYRIELDEIKAVLVQHDEVKDAVVVCNDKGLQRQLIAYVIRASEKLTTNELDSHLKSKLPEYMLPKDYVFLKHFPLTSNGKVDNKALPKPTALASEKVNQRPRSKREKEIAKIWSEVLHIGEVNLTDNFFELGGHSLAAIKVVTRLHKRMDVEVPVRVLFEHPTVEAFAKYLDEFKNEYSLKGDKRIVERKWDEENIPLSYAQKRMWFIHRMESETGLYNVPLAFRITGLLDVRALKDAYKQIIDRHKILKVLFFEQKGEPYQKINEKHTLPFEEINIENLSGNRQEAYIENFIAKEKETPFHLNEGPLLRMSLLTLGNQEHILMINMHHIITDGWSMGVFMNELATLYDVTIRNKKSPLEKLPIQYFDFAAWQKEWLNKGELNKQLNYWKSKLADLSVLQLPVDKPRPPFQTYNGANQQIEIPFDLSNKVQAFHHLEGTSLYMTLLTVFKILLYSYAGQKDIVVGTPVSNRSRSEAEGAIGFFVNTLVLRNHLDDSLSFRELLSIVKETVLNGMQNQDIPFEKLVQELQSARDMSYSPLFQVMFQLDEQINPKFETLRSTPIDVDSDQTKFDLALDVKEKPEKLVVKMNYNTDLFAESTITRMLKNYQYLIKLMISEADRPLKDMNLFRPEERKRQLINWNQTKEGFPDQKCIHELFEEQVANYPNQIAVMTADRRLTYKELNDCSNQLAHYLKKYDVGPGVIAGLYMDKSVDMIIGLLGILKTGGGYLPIDSDYPDERIAFMLADSNTKVIVTKEKLFKAKSFRQTAICLDRKWPIINNEPTDKLQCGVTASDPVNVIYTSGSTGKPKGVLVTHRNLVNHSTFFARKFKLSAQDRVLQFMSISFDFAGEEIFPTLISGATLYILEEKGTDYTTLNQLIEQFKLNAVHLPAAYWHEWISEMKIYNKPIPENLRFVNVGGEKVLKDKVSYWNKLCKNRNVDLFNTYGPTETTITSIYYQHSGDYGPQQSELPIGKPIANTQVYVLNEYLQPVPIGASGELYIGGEGVTVGYLNRDDLTEKTFINHSFQENSNCRLYKTGDIVRYKEDGNLEYLGRADQQVKIRGFRIEPGEIESVLLKYENIKETVVEVSQTARQKVLTAYIVKEKDSPLGLSKLKEFLKEQLPDYMVPSVFIFLNELPMTLNGKIDRKKLPVPEHQTEPGKDFAVPKDKEEKIIAGIWAEVLGVSQVSTSDNFFEIGGHSLLAIKVISRMKDQFKINLEVRNIFEAPTVEELAGKIKLLIRDTNDHNTKVPEIRKRKPNQQIPLTFEQEAIWVHENLSENEIIYNVPNAFRLKGELHIEALEKSFHKLIRRQEVLRTTFSESEGEAIQVIQRPWEPRLNIIDLSESSDDKKQYEAEKLLKQEAQKPFNLTLGPLVRIFLIRLSPREHILALNMHHIICDALSIRILLDEMGCIYESFISSRSAMLDELTIQYSDYACWQRSGTVGNDSERVIEYWSRLLEGCPPPSELPTDRPRSVTETHKGRILRRALPQDLHQSIKKLTHDEGLSLFMTLLSGFFELIYMYTGEEDLSIGTLLANRDKQELEKTVGYFINPLVLRCNLQGNPTFRQVLKQVHELLLEVYSHKTVSLAQLTEAAGRNEKNPSSLFHILFELQTEDMHHFDISGVEIEPVHIDIETAKFDINVALIEKANELWMSVEYNSDLFEEKTITDMMTNYTDLLEAVTDNPDTRLREIDSVGSLEKDFQELFQ